MLKELRIENFAIIDQINLQLNAGLITFTGETGAGKSILIDAVETLLGGRADATMVRSGCERANVEGVFHLSESIRAQVLAILEREELADDPEFVTVAREIRLNGRNVARVNGRSVNATLLREIGEFLIDVHGQSEHLSLLRISEHHGLLDSYAGVQLLLAAYQKTFHGLAAVRRELADLRQAERESARRIDTLNYQINEIEAAHLHPGEEEALREERNRLANAEGLATLAQEALRSLDEGDAETPAASDLFGQAVHALNNLARLDPSQSSVQEQAAALFDSLADITRDLRNYLENIEFNPRRLDQVEERLGMIQTLKRKYGESIPAIIAYSEQARTEVEKITHAGERIQELEAEEGRLLEQIGKEGIALSQKRHEQAQKMSRAIEGELLELQMSGTRFEVDFQMHLDPLGAILEDGSRVAFDANGLERVEFLIAPNPGEGLKPLVKIASGGETSRLMLALKNVLASADQIPTLIFDEIDQGIGGRVGGVVGQKLWRLAGTHQVLCVTHLPQLAAYGEQHYHVEKLVDEGRTITRVRKLSGENRLNELAQMLGGISAGTLQSAREILEAIESQPHERPAHSAAGRPRSPLS
jgi:DNA repair protein RecN (Recombination protein N)